MPQSAGAGLSDRVTLLPEWRPMPAQDTARRMVRCEVIQLSRVGNGVHNTCCKHLDRSKDDAAAHRSRREWRTSLTAGTYVNPGVSATVGAHNTVVPQPQADSRKTWLF